MDILNIALLLGAAGVGGAIGAIAAAIVAGGRLQAAFADFAEAFADYFESNEDPASRPVRSAFSELEAAVSGLSANFARLKRALSIR